MRKTIVQITCDRCWDELPGPLIPYVYFGAQPLDSGIEDTGEEQNFDICPSCKAILLSVMRGSLPTNNNEARDVLRGLLSDGKDEGPGEDQESEKKTKVKPRANIDVGKIGALHKAGWPAEKIADEMSINVGMVNYYIKKIAREAEELEGPI